jgi:hypothetical protein
MLSLNTAYFSAVRPVILARLFVTVRPTFENVRSEATLVAGKDSVAASGARKACGTKRVKVGHTNTHRHTHKDTEQQGAHV